MNHVPTVWWTGDRTIGWGGWTDDANKALRYPTKEAADAIVKYESSRKYLFGEVVEHVWLSDETSTPLAPLRFLVKLVRQALEVILKGPATFRRDGRFVQRHPPLLDHFSPGWPTKKVSLEEARRLYSSKAIDPCEHLWVRRRDGSQCSLCGEIRIGEFL